MKKIPLLLATACLFSLMGADPTQPLYWSASQLKDADKKANSKLNPERHLGTERLLDSAFVAYRNGPGEPELHEKLADLIIVRSGSGGVLIGGKMIGGKPSAPDEVRGGSIEGGTKYPIAAGDTLYVPAGVVHQFVMDPGQAFTAMVVKVTPKQ
jgi:mannose-6-phosphate isomerase-like protein (cupin superfamily)